MIEAFQNVSKVFFVLFECLIFKYLQSVKISSNFTSASLFSQNVNKLSRIFAFWDFLLNSFNVVKWDLLSDFQTLWASKKSRRSFCIRFILLITVRLAVSYVHPHLFSSLNQPWKIRFNIPNFKLTIFTIFLDGRTFFKCA